MKSPLCYIGGKSRLARRIVAEVPEHELYAEVFCGAGWVFFAKEESGRESINDLNSDLIAFYRVLQNHLEEFCRQFKWLLSSREWFNDFHHQLPAGGLTDIQRAARYYYLQRHAFGGKVCGRTFGVSPMRAQRINLLRLEEDLSAVHLRLSKVAIECLSWPEYISRYDRPGTLFYLDPPYYGFEDLYGKDLFIREDFASMAQQLARIKGKFIMSINDVAPIRDLFRAFRIKKVSTQYCMRKISKAVHELLITNY